MDEKHENNIRKVRYAVVGLGYIAQSAMLPAFVHSKSNSTLAALVSGDPQKLQTLGKKYKVKNLYNYEQYEECLSSGLIDAVYIALPNSLHCDTTIRAAKHGIHVLCEKPMATSEEECQQMIDVCSQHQVKLMIAYRLHFERANLEVLDIVKSGRIGDPVIFNSTFSMQVAPDNIRTSATLGGGALYDIGIYCINAARTIFEREPRAVFGLVSNPDDPRFETVDGLTTGILEFDNGRIANFSASFGAANSARYEIIGTKGSIALREAFEYESEMEYELTINDKTEKRKFSKSDQFAPELTHFSECILTDTPTLPSGHEGGADIKVIAALYQSAQLRTMISLTPAAKHDFPQLNGSLRPPPVRKPPLVNAEQPSMS